MSTASPRVATAGALLEVRDLHTHFETDAGVARAVDGVSFTIAPGRTLGIVGESGCGKSVTALSILRLVSPPGRIVGGAILYKGDDLLALSERAMRRVRGNEIAMIFQEPMTSLEPGVHDRQPDRRGGAPASESRPSRDARAGDRGAARSSRCPSRSGAPTPTRTSSRAACDSAR